MSGITMKDKTVAVIGCGGLGGYAGEYLVRLGVGCIKFADGDVFTESNLNRQLLCTPDTLGNSKAVEAARRARLVSPQVNAVAVEEYLTDANADGLLAGCDLVIDALDNMSSREMLLRACERLGIDMIHGGIGRGSIQLAVLKPGMKLPPSAAGEFHGEDMRSYVPALCAALQINEADKLLQGKKSELEGKLLCMDLDSMESLVIEL